ncbi:hypothetical protein C7271_09885 [filamentous cyanobacterium CCP5]|nr:hypothetical protein C7271_09885 [filamentous cyanobacterium CCP5]
MQLGFLSQSYSPSRSPLVGISSGQRGRVLSRSDQIRQFTDCQRHRLGEDLRFLGRSDQE